MSDVPQASEAFEGWVVLANELLGRWTQLASGIAAQIDAGTYDDQAAAAEFPKAAKLGTDSLFLIGSEAVDAISILTSDFSEQTKVTGYGTDPKLAGTTRTLAWKDDLVSVTGEELPQVKARLAPAILPPGQTQFTVEVDGSGLKARTYDGYVVATSAATAAASASVEEIFVSVTIG
ncbi:MAG TPA: hypothetical protein VJ782_07800 [Aeromicrobium sp.]|nr:hypothetical protein [Aeromicrobium sp.]